MKKLHVLTFTFLFLFSNSLHSLTFKKDGTVVSSSGEVLTESMKDRYTKALAAYRNGEEVTDYPIAQPEDSGGLFGIFSGQGSPKGFFGDDIVEEGAPLFPLPRDIDMTDPINSIAKNLGMNSNQFVAALVSTASDGWLDENGIEQETVPSFDRTVDEFIEAERQLEELTAEGVIAINATGLSPDDIRSGAFDSLLSDTELLLEAAPILLGAPVEVQMAFESRAISLLASEGGLDLPSLEKIDIDFEALDAEAIAEGARLETDRLISQGINAVNGTDLTVQDVLDGKLDETIGIDTALVNASEEVYAAYDRRINEKLALEQGIVDTRQFEFVNRAVMDAGAVSAEEAGIIAAQAATQFNNADGAASMAEAQIASQEADRLADVAKQLEEVAIKEGTEEAKVAAEEAAKAAEQAAEAAQLAGEAAMFAAGGAASRTAQEAAWEAASQNAYDNAISAAMAAGASAEEAAAQAAEAAASAGQAAFEAAALAAGQSAEEAAQNAAAEAAEQSALRDLERRLESGEITEAQFNEALNDGSIPDGAPRN